MLVLSRSPNESIVIAEEVLVTVRSVSPDGTELAITPDTVAITTDPPLETAIQRTDRAILIPLQLNESFVINDDILITLIHIRPDKDKVRLGFQLPLDMSVHRKEVHDAIVEMNRRQRLERE